MSVDGLTSLEALRLFPTEHSLGLSPGPWICPARQD